MSILANITPFDPNRDTDISTIQELRKYARRAVHHGLKNFDNEGAPFNGDLMYNQMFKIFGDKKQQEIYNNVSLAWKKDASEIHVYSDLGITEDMKNRVSKINEHNPEANIYLTSIYNEKKSPISIDSLLKLNLPLKINPEINQGYKLSYEFSPKPELRENIVLPEDIPHFSNYKRVIMESPFAGDVKNNVRYAKISMLDLSLLEYAPSASHLMYTQMLDDTIEADRNQGIDKGLDIAHNIDTIVRVDRGYSNGIKYGVIRAEKEGRNISFSTISQDPKTIEIVSSISNFDDFVDFTEQKKKENKELFEQTGYTIPNFDAENMIRLMQEQKNKRGLKK